MGLNKSQEIICGTLDMSVNVSAGAGTGKTYTLTQRIVRAIDAIIESRDLLDDECAIDHILAITFTEAAAAELKSRVRDALLERHLETKNIDYLKCALRVDSSWISTIHSMAARILRENSVRFGIDPSFTVIDAIEAEVIHNEAFNRAIVLQRETEDSDIQSVLESFRLNKAGFSRDSIQEMISAIATHVEFMPLGMDGIELGKTSRRPIQILEDMRGVSNNLLACLRAADFSKSKRATADEYERQSLEALDRLDEYINQYVNNSFDSSDFQAEVYFEVLCSFPSTTNAFGNNSGFDDGFIKYRRQYMELLREAIFAFGSRLTIGIRKLALEVEKIADDLKRTQNAFEHSDLLIRCNEELARPENKDLLVHYQDHFDQIMLDEFQDTDKLQMQIVRRIAKKDIIQDSGNLPSRISVLKNVCTVGDMQQSIYRFRGGDVQETLNRIEDISIGGGKLCSLTENYRTHEDILNVVEKVFSSNEVFGKDFLSLQAKCPNLDIDIAKAFESAPRVKFEFINKGYVSKADKENGKDYPLNMAELREIAANDIAEHFSWLIENGAKPNEFAILLGAMTNAHIYADALRKHGIDSMVTGGSVFSKTQPAQLVQALLNFVANKQDMSSLLTILTSRLVNISDDAILEVSNNVKKSTSFRDSLGVYFLRGNFDAISNLPIKQELMRASDLLRSFSSLAKYGAVRALRRLFLDSGLLDRISENENPDELAYAGNIKKALKIVQSIEEKSSGTADLAIKYAKHLELEKDTPGSLAVDNANFVRIMTVHASKGLEFKHVAVSDLRDGVPKAERLIVENVNQTTYVSLNPPDTFIPQNAYSSLEYMTKNFSFEDEFEYDAEKAIEEESNPSDIRANIEKLRLERELAEARRLMYVAMTRARESLFVCHVADFCPSGKSDYKGVYADIKRMLLGHFNPASGDFDLNYKAASNIIGFTRKTLTQNSLLNEDVDMDISNESAKDFASYQLKVSDDTSTITKDCEYAVQTFTIPVKKAEPLKQLIRKDSGRYGVFSYSSINEIHEPSDMVEILGVSAHSSEIATSIGTAFHRLAQASIMRLNDMRTRLDCSMSKNSACESTADTNKNVTNPVTINTNDDSAITEWVLSYPSESEIHAQAKFCELDDNQVEYLVSALNLWFGSEISKQLASYDQVLAEIPFMTKVSISDDYEYLTGEIDALGFNDGLDEAFLVDYKTGGNQDEQQAELFEKHRLQATCYAYALLKVGFNKVKASFVRVNQPDQHRLGEPQVVRYEFDITDMQRLEETIKSSCVHASTDSVSTDPVSTDNVSTDQSIEG